jgi:hypothetical protein
VGGVIACPGIGFRYRDDDGLQRLDLDEREARLATLVVGDACYEKLKRDH